MSDIQWQSSSFCGGGGNNCVEMRSRPGAVQIRESEEPTTVVTTTPARLRALVHSIKRGTLDDLP
jgi:hypothetical protein